MFNRTFTAFAVVFAMISAAAAADPVGSLVHVSGRGLVRVSPDQVVIDITAKTTDDDLIRVRQNSDKEAHTILTIAKKHGVDDNGFEVSRLELSLSYNDQLRRQIYQVERDITLRLADLAKLDALLSDLLRERNLSVSGINFGTSKARQHEFEARSRAVSDAKEKAAHLAELNGFKLGKAIDIHVIGENFRPFVTSVIPAVGAAEPPSRQHKRRGSDPVVTNLNRTTAQFVAFQPAKDETNADGQPFALGQIEITAEVEIDFELVK